MPIGTLIDTPARTLAAAAVAATLFCWSTGCKEEKTPIEWNVGVVMETKGRGVKAQVETGYGSLYIIRLEGSHYEMGYQYGWLLAEELESMWDVYVLLAAEELGMDPELAEDFMNLYLDQGWDHMLPHIPQPYLDEIQGVTDGAADSGKAPDNDAGEVVRRAMMMEVTQADEFGDMSRMSSFFRDGYSEPFQEYFGIASTDLVTDKKHAHMLAMGTFEERVQKPFRFPQMACSYFAIWGPHTDGRLLAMRNMDWDEDVGLADLRALTVYVPDGEIPHVTIGYIGFVGALAGMNAEGIALGGVGSTNALERLKAEPQFIKTREVLANAATPEEAALYQGGDVGDGILRPNSIGANGMVAWGDPRGGGAQAGAAALELSGIFVSMFRQGPDCAVEALLYEYDLPGNVAYTYDHSTDPDLVNLEADAYEIDATGNVRTFQVDANNEFVRDANGNLIDDATGLPYPVGLAVDCALYRGDEALAYGVRKYQIACHGPLSDSADKQMHRCGSYRDRYTPMHDMIVAYDQGTEFSWDGQMVIPDNGGVPVPIGPEQAVLIARIAAMNSNIFSVVYDATNLELWVAFESGTGATWVRAADNEYFHVRLADLLP